MKVNEIYFSIQGESSFAGEPCIFIRTTFCNLRCTYCDTKYSYFEGEDMSIDEIMDKISTFPSKLIEITGGEPLLQSDINDLALRLFDEGYTVLCETSGSLDIDKISNKVHRIIDLKTPDSGEEAKNHYKSMGKLTDRDEIKFVICSKKDYEWSKAMISKYDLINRVTVLMSPEHENMDAKILAEWILEDGLNVKMQLQMHKFIWDSKERGV
jgi:7-carboxy-7-deazaguanine synthase